MNGVPISGEWTDSPPKQPPPIAPRTQKKLNIVLPFIESDTPNVIRLLKWCAELSGKVPYTIFLLPFKGLNFTEVKMYAERAFADVQVIQDGEGVTSDWKTDSQIRDAAGPNSMFRQAAWFFYFHQGLGSWLYLEPDCVPLKKDWIEQLEADHFGSGSLISGQKMSVGDKPYLNGVAIYPPNVINEAPEIVTQVMWQQHADMEIAFDIAGGDKVLQKAHLTDKIQLGYRTKPFDNWYEVDAVIKPEAVLFHGDRDGSLIPFLQRGALKGGDAPCQTTTKITPEQSHVSNGAADVQPVASAEGKLRFVELEPQRFIIKDGKYVPVDAPTEERKSNPAWTTPTEPSLGEQIRFHVNALAELENGQPSRKQRIVDELRKRKLIPRARTQWKLPRR